MHSGRPFSAPPGHVRKAEACLACSAGVIKGTEPGATRTFTKHDRIRWTWYSQRGAALWRGRQSQGCRTHPLFSDLTWALCAAGHPVKSLPHTQDFSSLSLSSDLPPPLPNFTGEHLSSFTVKTERMTSCYTNFAALPLDSSLPSPRGSGRIHPCLADWVHPLPFHILECSHAVASFPPVILSSP